MSDTPRTDAEAAIYLKEGYSLIGVNFARQLERELTAAKRRLAAVRRSLVSIFGLGQCMIHETGANLTKAQNRALEAIAIIDSKEGG